MSVGLPSKSVAIMGLAHAADAVSPALVVAAKQLGASLGSMGTLVYMAADDRLLRYVAEGGAPASLRLIAFSPAGNVTEHVETYRYDTTWVDGVVCTGSAGAGYVRTMLHSVAFVIMVGDCERVIERFDALPSGATLIMLTDADPTEVHRMLETHSTTIKRLVVAASLPLALKQLAQ